MNDPLLSAFGDPLDVEEDTPLNQFGHPLDLVPEDPVEIPEADRGPARGITEEPLKLDPDRAARIHRAVEVTGMHPIVVRDNLEEVERRFRLQQINDLVVQDPALGRVMENPIAAGLAHGEAESLSLLGQTVRSFRNFGGAWASAIPAFSGGLWQLVRAGAEVTGLDGLAEYAKEGAESADYTARWLNPPNPNPILNTAYSGLQSAGQTLALTAGGTPRLVVAGLSALSAGHAYGQAREAGLDPLAAVIYGAGQGAIEGMTERLSASALVDLLKGTGTSLLSSLRRFAFGEALGEQLATLLQDFQEWVVLNPEKSAEEFGDERLPAALETLIATAVSVGASGTVAQGLSALRERREAADRAAQQRQLLDQLMKGSSASHLRAADPAAFQAYLDESSRQENGDPGVFYLDGRSFAQALSESGVQIDQLREQSPELVQRLAEAVQTDGDVVVPMAEFVTLFADSPAADRLTMIVRESEHAMSAEEAAAFAQSGAAEQFNAVIDEALQKAARGEADVLERDLVRDQIREQVAQQLTALGRWTPEVVDTNASIAATLYARAARHMGLTPMEFIDRYVPQVESAAQPGASAVLQAARDEVGGTRERTDTPEFRNWFGRSRAVDSGGQPLIMYHGTASDFVGYRRGSWFSSSPDEASAYGSVGLRSLLRGDQIAGKYTVGRAPDGLAGGMYPYYGTDGLPSDAIPGHVYVSDLGVFRREENGRWRVLEDVVANYDVFNAAEDPAGRGLILVERGDAREAAEEYVRDYEEMVARVTSDARSGGRVEPVYLSIQNPVEMDPFSANRIANRLGMDDVEIESEIRALEAQGYDGIATYSDEGSLMGEAVRQYVAFRPEQIKSVFNRGGWDPSNPDTLAQSARRSTSDVGHKRDKSGRYVGAPDWIGASPEKLKVLRRQLKKLALEGGASRYWYEDSARAVLELVNSDPVEAEKFIGLLAIYSQGTDVSANVTFALTAYYQWKNGLPIDTGRFPVEQSRKAEDVLRHDTGWGGIKTNNFYSDLMEEIDPAKVDGDHATMDMWMALAFDYGSKVLDQGPKYGFAKREITRLAAELGIRPHQAQAQVWAAIKYRVESTAAERNEIERRTGIQVKDKKGKWHVPKAQEKSHFRLATKLGMGMDANQADIDDAKYDFSDALRARTIQMSWGVSPEGLPGIHDAPMAQKLEYLSAIRAALADESGRDLIADMTGLPQGVAGEGVRARDGLTDVGVQTLVPVALEGTGKGRTLRSTSRDIVELSAAIRGYVLGQASVSYHHPVPGDAKIRHNGVSLETVRPLTAEEVQLLQAALVGRFGPDGVSLDWSADRVTVLNQGDGNAVDNGPFQKAFRETVEALPDDFGGSMTLATFRAEGGSVTNDWQVNPNGESYLERITGRRPDLLGRVADLRARVEAVNAAFAARYGWDQPAPVGQSYSQSGRDGQSVRGPAAIGVSPASGVHFSSQRRTVLDGRYYGTGLRGAEAERIAAATDPRLRERVYVYIDEGGGVRPESGVGAYAHEVRLPTLYDMYTDPLKLNGILNTDINAWESAILDAGFHGYYSRTRPQAAAVVIGDASRAIQAVPIDAPPVPGLGPSVNVAPARYSAVLSSAEIDAIDMEAIRAVAPSANLRMGQFTVDAAEAGAARAKAAEKGVELPARSLYQEAGPPRGLYTPDTNTISLLEGADLSTFLHELGHFGLEMMMEIAARENAPQQVIDDVKTLLKWFGVADLQTWQGMTLEQKREYHEKFAEGFETYLFEGVAPALDLTGAFNRVRQWMSDVYRMLSSEMNVQLDDEVRAVFDRMLASEDQIAEQQRIREMMPSFESADQVGVEAWEEMQRLGEEASQTAINNLRARTLRDLRWFANAKSRQLKKLQKTSREIRAGLRADVSREVYNRPVYAAFRFIATGVAEDRDLTNAQRKAIDTVAGQKTQLSMPALRAFYGEQSPIPGMLDRKLVRNEGGADPDAVAVAFGFDSGDAMVRALLEAEPAEPLIDSIVDRRMLEEHADLSSPLDIERAAEAAIYNDARARLAATEVRAIAEGLNAAEATGGTVTVPETVIPETVDRHGRVRKAHTRKAYTRSLTVNGLVRAATQYADAIVGRSTPRQLTPLTHSRAATKAATLARQAQRDGDMATALQHHRNRLLHTKTAQRMEEARNEFGRIEAYLRRFQGPVNPKASIDVDYQEQIRNILQAIDTRANTNRRAQALESLREWISEQEAAGLPVALDEKLLNEAQATNIKDLTMDQLRGLVDQIRHVEHLGRLKKKLLTARDQREFEDIRDSIADRVRRFGGVARPVPFNPSAPDGSAGRAIREYFAEHRKLSSLVRQMDGGEDGGYFWQTLIRPMNEAGDREQALKAYFTQKLNDIYRPILKAPGGINGDRRLITSMAVSMSRAERMAVALNWGNELSRQRVLNTFSQEAVDEILGTLTDPELSVVQQTWDLINELWPDIAAKEKRVVGVVPEKVDALPFTVTRPDGTVLEMRGGYYPLHYEAGKSDRVAAMQEAADMKAVLPGAALKRMTRRGHLDARNEKSSLEIKLTLDVIGLHLDQAIHDLAWHEWLIDSARVLYDRKVSTAIREHYGAETLRVMKEMRNQIALGDLSATSRAEKVGMWLRATASTSTMGLSATVSLLQPFGILNGIARVGIRNVLKGFRHWLGDWTRMESAMSNITAKSSFMKHRAQTFNRELVEVMAQVHYGKSAWKGKATQLMFAPMQRMQLLADIPTWYGGYEKALAEGFDEAGAVALADQAVIDAQGSGMTKDLSRVQSGSAFNKMMSVYFSYFNATWNLLEESRGRAVRLKNPKAMAGWLRDVILLVILPATGPEIVKEFLRAGEDDDEEGEWLARRIGDVASYSLGFLFIVREFSGIAQGYDYNGPAFSRVIKDLGGTLAESRRQLTDEDAEFDDDAMRRILRGIFTASGLPSTQIDRLYTGWRAWEDGEAGPGAILLGPPPRDR